jgi:hypothetical protein
MAFFLGLRAYPHGEVSQASMPTRMESYFPVPTPNASLISSASHAAYSF